MLTLSNKINEKPFYSSHHPSLLLSCSVEYNLAAFYEQQKTKCDLAAKLSVY